MLRLLRSCVDVQLSIGFSLLALGILLTTCVCCCCCMIVKFARGNASGKTQRPHNPVGGVMYDVAGKYGNYIPGGAALNRPASGQAMQDVPIAGVNQPPPQGYPGSGTATGYGQKYDGNTSYDSSSSQKPGAYYASPAEYSPYGRATGGAPAGYPAAV
jgi:hypothetical protein